MPVSVAQGKTPPPVIPVVCWVEYYVVVYHVNWEVTRGKFCFFEVL